MVQQTQESSLPASRLPAPRAECKASGAHRVVAFQFRPVPTSGTGACPGQAWPVRLCNRPVGRDWPTGACGTGCSLLHTSSSHFSQSMHRPCSSSLMKTLAVMCIAFARVNAFLVVCHSHTPDGKDHCGHRPRPEQPQLNPTSTAENESCCGSACRYCTGNASG